VSHFKAKMHQIRFWLSLKLRPRTRWGANSATPYGALRLREGSAPTPIKDGEGESVYGKGGRGKGLFHWLWGMTPWYTHMLIRAQFKHRQLVGNHIRAFSTWRSRIGSIVICIEYLADLC